MSSDTMRGMPVGRPNTSKTYLINQSRITLTFGDITSSEADVLVSSDDDQLSMGGGVSAAIARAAGPRVAEEAARRRPAKIGDIVVTSAGTLRQKYVFHAVVKPVTARLDVADQQAVIRQTVDHAMRLLPMLGCRSIAFPAIGTGFAGVPFETAANEMASTLIRSLLHLSEECSVELYLKEGRGQSRTDLTSFFSKFEEFVRTSLALDAETIGGTTVLEPPGAASPKQNGGDKGAGREEYYSLLQELDVRSHQLEARLLALLTDSRAPAEDVPGQVKQYWSELQALRRDYAADLGLHSTDVAPDSVFLSSTFTDLQPERKAAQEALGELGLARIEMEQFPASTERSAKFIRQQVNRAGIYVGILGFRYGMVDPVTGISLTELEYKQASITGKPRYLFVKSDDAPISASLVEKDPAAYKKMMAFRVRILNEHVVVMFKSTDELRAGITATLSNFRHA